VKKQISALQTKITKDIDEGLKKQLTAVQNGLMGVSAAFAASSCQTIKDKQPSAQEGPYWITSRVDKKAVIVWCANVGSKFYSLGGDGSTKGQAASSCFSQPLITGNPKGNWIDPNVNAEDPSNAVQINCGDGRGKTTAGLTCKSIKLKWGVTSNKHYWVIGRNMEFASSPKEVFCWQNGRDGGGWTLVLRSYYQGHQRPTFNGNGVVTTGNVKSDPLQHLGGIYKMHDHEIRAVIGQAKHTDDSASAPASKFSYLMDQSGRNVYYSGGNYEYLSVKDYTARWRFYRFQGVPKSKTKATMRAYDMNYNFDGKSRGGDGQLNWQGEPCCGKSNGCSNPTGAGISCYNTRSGTPQQSPNAGRGCHRNRGYDRWHGPLHVYMCETNHDSYMYVCNGPQHSSSNRFAHRTWMRTPDEDLIG